MHSSAHLADPVRHHVSAWGAVVSVDDNHSYDDGGNNEDHGEEHVLPDKWYSTGGGGDQLHNDQQEHSQGQQDGDTESHLLTCETQQNILTGLLNLSGNHLEVKNKCAAAELVRSPPHMYYNTLGNTITCV